MDSNPIAVSYTHLALGGRADRDMIRTGEDYALVEPVFELEKKEQADRIRALDIPVEEDGMVILQRRIMPGRSFSLSLIHIWPEVPTGGGTAGHRAGKRGGL